MPGAPGTFVLVTLAMNQTVFLEAVGEAIKDKGHEVIFLCFHERSHDYLQQRGQRSFNAFRTCSGKGSADSIDLRQYAWPSLNLVLSHEKAAFELRDTPPLVQKLRSHLAAAEACFAHASTGGRGVTVIQELGGFLSNVAAFYAARRRGIDNIFIEPAFFRGRVAFSCNSFAAPQVAGPRSEHVRADVRDYVNNAVAEQRIVIPKKDTRHYRSPLSKLTDPHNARRLVAKMVDRHLLGKREQFADIGGHVSRHLRMFLTSQALSRRYTGLSTVAKPFVYYPLHVPADVALTLRSPQYLDQLSLIDYLARIIPGSHDLLIKEHPALIGAVNRRRMLQLLDVRDNVRLLNPGTPNYQILGSAEAVITVNSKSGAEALVLGRPVIVLGDAFYSGCELVHRVRALADLPSILSRVLEGGARPEPTGVLRYLQDVWDHSWPGELHVPDPENARAFGDSLLRYLQQA